MRVVEIVLEVSMKYRGERVREEVLRDKDTRGQRQRDNQDQLYVEDKGVCLCVSMCMRDNKKGVGSVGVFWGLNREREREREG